MADTQFIDTEYGREALENVMKTILASKDQAIPSTELKGDC